VVLFSQLPLFVRVPGRNTKTIKKKNRVFSAYVFPTSILVSFAVKVFIDLKRISQVDFFPP